MDRGKKRPLEPDDTPGFESSRPGSGKKATISAGAEPEEDDKKTSAAAGAAALSASTTQSLSREGRPSQSSEVPPTETTTSAAAAAQHLGTSAGQGKSKRSRRRKSDSTDQKKRSADQLNFPERLMHLVVEKEAPDHVSWIENEEAICFKTSGFQQQVLDRFFQGLKYDSFVRKLNRWGFRRVTSDGVPQGCVAYYHNSFRKDEQELIKTMGIGKKNDPEVRDLHAFGSEHSPMIAAASLAAAATAGGGGGGETGHPAAGPPSPLVIESAERQHSHEAVMNRPTQSAQVSLVHQTSGGVTARASPTASASASQESKDEPASGLRNPSAPLVASPQRFLEATVAGQGQTQEAPTLAESILLQQSRQQQQQQQHNVSQALAAAVLANARGNDIHMAPNLAALIGQSAAPSQPQNPYSRQPQLPQPQQLGQQLNGPAMQMLLQGLLQSSATTIPQAGPNHGVGLGAAAALRTTSNLSQAANLLLPSVNPSPQGGNVANLHSLMGILNPNNIPANNNPLTNNPPTNAANMPGSGNNPPTNVIANANPQGNANLEDLLRFLLENRQPDNTGQRQDPSGTGPAR